MAYILAIDLGSTQMKLMIMDEKANIIMTVSEAYPSFVKTYWMAGTKSRGLGKSIKNWNSSTKAKVRSR